MPIFKKSRQTKSVRFCSWILMPLLVMAFASTVWAGSDIPSKKQTSLKLYVNAKQAWEKWSANPGKIHILDVRTPAEYIFIGHAPMAVNIPIRFLGDTLNPVTLKPLMPKNDHFIKDIGKKFKKNDTILVMCRSGSRSAAAVNIMAKEGFKHVYNIIDGFEGDALKNTDGYQNGKRIINGWKNSGAPWTYKLKRELAYLP